MTTEGMIGVAGCWLCTVLIAIMSVGSVCAAQPKLRYQRRDGYDIRAIAFSADGSRIASAGMDGTITLWEGKSGQRIATLQGHQSRITEVVFSSNGRLIVSS